MVWFGFMAYPYLPTPPLGQDMTQGQFLSGVYQVWIQSFPSSCLAKAEESSLPYYLSIGHINHCRLLIAKSSLYIYIKYIWLGLVGFYGISTIVGYLMPNPFYTCILDIYDL